MKERLKEFVRSRLLDNNDFRKSWKKANPFVGGPYEFEFIGSSEFKVAIAFDHAHYHRYFISACLDLNISFKVVDLLGDDWLSSFERETFVGLLIWPHLNSNKLKEILDERLMLLEKYTKIKMYPEAEGIYLLDNKRRVRDWLYVNNFKIPQTWCFTDREKALEFIDNVELPIVHKSVQGSVSRGVEIIKKRSRARSIIKRCFTSGIYPYRMDRRNIQWDFVMFQEYLEDCKEKRIIVVGESFFSIEKLKGNDDYMSGSGYMRWGENEEELFLYSSHIMERGNFRNMNVDFLIDQKGNFYVNELHSLFHGPRITDENRKGRYIRDKGNNSWKFEPGNYYRNYTTNLRVIDFLKSIGIDYTDKSWLSKDVFFEVNGLRM